MYLLDKWLDYYQRFNNALMLYIIADVFVLNLPGPVVEFTRQHVLDNISFTVPSYFVSQYNLKLCVSKNVVNYLTYNTSTSKRGWIENALSELALFSYFYDGPSPEPVQPALLQKIYQVTSSFYSELRFYFYLVMLLYAIIPVIVVVLLQIYCCQNGYPLAIAYIQHWLNGYPQSYLHYLGDYSMMNIIAHGTCGSVVYSGVDQSKIYKIKDSDLLAFKIVDIKQFQQAKKTETNTVKKIIMDELQNMHACSGSPYVMDLLLSCMYGQQSDLIMMMRCFTAGSLKQQSQLKRPHGFAEHEIIYIAKQLILGLEWIHGRGIIHHDINPSNILLTDEGNIKISDFGSSTCYAEGDVASIRQTAGTPGFTAPETMFQEPQSYTVDYWSLGSTLYNMNFPNSTPYIPLQVPPMHLDKYKVEIQLAYQYLLSRKTFRRNEDMYSETFYKFLSELLELDPVQRLGSPKSQFGLIQNHQIFDDVSENRYKPTKLPIYQNICVHTKNWDFFCGG